MKIKSIGVAVWYDVQKMERLDLRGKRMVAHQGIHMKDGGNGSMTEETIPSEVKRYIGADVFRILCCLGVLTYHIMDDVLALGECARFLYYAASFCVPGFFLLSGFLSAGKEYGLEYYERKTISTAKKLFGWIIFWAVIRFLRTGELLNVFDEFLAGANSEGVLPVAWFLFTYMFIIGIAAYPLHLIERKSKLIVVLAGMVWMVGLALRNSSQMTDCTQSRWLYLYLGYYVLGMAMYELYENWRKITIVARLLAEVLMFIISSCLYYYNQINLEICCCPDENYGKWFYTPWIVSILLLCLEFSIQNKLVQTIISRMGKNTMVVYLGHLPILLYITAIRPLTSLMGACVLIIILFLSLEIMAEIFKKLPLLNKLL